MKSGLWQNKGLSKQTTLIKDYMHDMSMAEINYTEAASVLSIDDMKAWTILKKSFWFESAERKGYFRLKETATSEQKEGGNEEIVAEPQEELSIESPGEAVIEEPKAPIDVPDSSKSIITDKCVWCGIKPKRSATAKTCDQRCAGFLAHQTLMATRQLGGITPKA